MTGHWRHDIIERRKSCEEIDMSIINNYFEYKEELELIHAQNRVECDLYSIIATIIRECCAKQAISLRDVSARRTTDFSSVFKSEEAGFPDFVIRTREKSNEAEILGAVEVKYITEDLDSQKHIEQVEAQLKFYKRLLYTNGLEWRFYNNGQCNEPCWKVTLGRINNQDLWLWNKDEKWKELLNKLRYDTDWN